MKTEFKLLNLGRNPISAELIIIGKAPEYTTYVAIVLSNNHQYYVADSDLEKLAVNILKALKSKKLKRWSQKKKRKS